MNASMRATSTFALVWIRDNDRRMEDNIAFQVAAKTGVPLFCCYFQSENITSSKDNAIRPEILSNEDLQSLDNQLRSDYNTRLNIVKGEVVVDCIRRIASQLSISHIYFNRESDRSGLELESFLRSLTGAYVRSFDSSSVEAKKVSPIWPLSILRNARNWLIRSPKSGKEDSISKASIPEQNSPRRLQDLRKLKRSEPIPIPRRPRGEALKILAY